MNITLPIERRSLPKQKSDKIRKITYIIHSQEEISTKSKEFEGCFFFFNKQLSLLMLFTNY